MVSLALPKGSYLERPVLGRFAAAGLEVRRPSERSYRARIDYDGDIEVAFHKAREIPLAVEKGIFDFGVTGADWIEETGAKVELVDTSGCVPPWRLVLAVPADHPAVDVAGLPPGVRVATGFPKIARQFFQSVPLPVRIVPSFGATEAKVPELADAVIEADGPDSAFDEHDLRVIATLRTCVPQLVASPAAWRETGKRAAIQKVARLLAAVDGGAAHVLLTVRTSSRNLPSVAGSMPERSWRAGTGLTEGLVVVQGLAARRGLAETIGGILAAGALDVIESHVGKDVTP
ncbi:ATP phosphoribosyltransferase [Nonomuraea sp. WAC 01424]|uniref:ATP phosphoribosyltransferase n=1 Tax=Nonomuraea sp. WAC 01424 TaxID=2203200 RepID=UPI00163D1EC7|nr:ATP phosphoribosyltransferase [Nonomuraea sp. WAC 01424]